MSNTSSSVGLPLSWRRMARAATLPGERYGMPACTVGRRVLLLLLLAAAVSACRQPATRTRPQPVTLTISAAADLTFAFQEIGKRFEAETGIRTIFNFGSTGQLAQQIERGAPVDLFAAADTAFIEALERRGLIVSDTKALYARGRLTLWTRADSRLRLAQVEDLARPEVQRLAIANPDHAPYGMAAREALQTAGIWPAVRPKLVMGENIRQTLQYAQTGSVDVAIVALSLSVRTDGRWLLVPQALHQPIDQALAVVRGTRHEPEARRFAAFVNGPEGRPIMRQYGFALPGEEATTP